MSAKYFHDFDSRESVQNSYGVADADMPTDEQILFADYTYEDYSGSSLVLFERDGKLFEVNGGHCSCYGLEDQWEPEETTWEALKMRRLSDSHDDAGVALRALIEAHTP